jgi:NAD(P)-dependent dehydrogenase (short-subunit alcohol dehydrogenase family)
MAPSPNQEKIVLVSGGNRGIGFEVCRQLAKEGLHVILGSRDRDKGRSAVDRLSKDGIKVRSLQLDVADPRSIQSVKSAIEGDYGRLDILINNAGVYLDEVAGILKMDERVFRETMEVNFYGPLRLCRAFVPRMIAQGYGRVVNVSSGLGAMDDLSGRSAAYGLSKLVLNGLTRVVADQTGRVDVKVNSACPGWVRTEMGGSSAPRSPEKGAETIVWLATLDKDGPTGGFFRDRKSIPW